MQDRFSHGECDPGRAQLVERAVAGDAVALMALLADTRARHVDYLNRWIHPALRFAISADDVIQDAHVETFRRIAQFRPDGSGSFDRWVATIALRRLRTMIRGLNAAKRGGGRDRTPVDQRIEDSTIQVFDLLVRRDRTPSKSAVRREVVAAVHDAINELSRDYRFAVWQVHIEGRSPGEVAASMGRTQRAVHGLCRRGLAEVRTKLESLPQFGSWH